MLNNLWPRVARYTGNRRFLTLLAGFLLGIYLLAFVLCQMPSKHAANEDCAVKFIKVLRDSGHRIYRYFRLQPWPSDLARAAVTSGAGLAELEHGSGGLMLDREYHRIGRRKTLFEYGDVCEGINRIWETYPYREVQGYITKCGKMIVTGVGTVWMVTGPRPIRYQGTYYFPWDKRQSLQTTYEGTIDYAVSRHLFIPVQAMFHTHIIGSELSGYDLANACEMSELSHLLFERGRIVSFDCDGITATPFSASLPCIGFE